VLDQALAGVYPSRRRDAIPVELAARFTNSSAGSVEMGPELHQAIEFKAHNLIRDAPPIKRADLVMCCNVTIYFSDSAFRKTVASLSGALREGGFLILGHSESLWRVEHPLELVDLKGAFAYRRPRAGDMRHEGAEPAWPSLSPSAPVTSEGRGSAPMPSVAVPSTPAVRREAAPRRVEVAELVATACGLLERNEGDVLDELLDEGLARAPSTAELHLLQGILRQRQGDDEAAESGFGRAIYCDPTCSLAWFYRASVFEARQEPLRAASDYATAAGCLARDRLDRWDQFLELMGHEGLIRHCRERAAALGMSEAAAEAKAR
jgi:chemotaxis protein methyltransferase CheR